MMGLSQLVPLPGEPTQLWNHFVVPLCTVWGCVSLVYIDYDNPDLILMDMSTYLDASIDAEYHARTSRGKGIQPLRRKSKKPYDYK
jgi:hypothetical protein